MRILNRPGRFLGWLLIVTILPLSSIFAQEKFIELKTFLDQATEEIPDHPKPQVVKQKTKLKKDDIKTLLQNVTEEIPDHPKPRFVSSKNYSKENLKIQLGFFKEKKNVSKMINNIKSKHNWSVFVKTENKNGIDYYRVMIVDISSKTKANAIIRQLKHEGLKGFIK
jgi:cell division septation protein DedD